MDWGSLIGAGVSLYSASQSKDAAKDAASAQIASSQDNIDFSKWLYNQQTELQKPYYNTGVAVLPMLQARAGIVPIAGMKPQLTKIPRYTSDQAAGIDNIYDYVSNLYIDGLGREGTQENIEKWTEKIASGQLNKQTIIDEFMKEADANKIQYDRDALTNIQQAINVNSSPMATTNYLNSYSSNNNGGGLDGAFGSGQTSGSTSTMNPNSSLGNFSFSGISDVLGEHGYTTSQAIGAISPIAGLTIAGLTALSDYAYDKDMELADKEYNVINQNGGGDSDGGWGSTSSEGGFGIGEGGFGGSDTGYDESGEGYE